MKSMCRICLTENLIEVSVPIFTSTLELTGVTWAEAMMACAPIHVGHEDGLPDVICIKCRNTIEIVLKFRQLCIKSDEALRCLTKSVEGLKQESIVPTNVHSKIEDSIVNSESQHVTDLTKLHEIREHFCGICQKSFQFASSFKVHERSHRPYRCNVCNKSFRLNRTLKIHRKTHTKVSYTRRNFPQNKPAEDTGLLSCSICGKICQDQRKLQLHSEENHNISRVSEWRCLKCNAIFHKFYDLKRHKRQHLKRPFQCGSCEKAFYTESEWKIHESCHSDARPYTCDICDMKFKLLCNLRAHIKTHSGSREYLCEVCGKGYSRVFGLEKHKKSHLFQETQDETLLEKCEICGKCCADLKKHIMVHSDAFPYKCDVCGKNFKWSSNLLKHKKVHNAEKPHVCSLCGIQFKRIDGLKRHMMIHAAGKPNTCHICQETFVTKRCLLHHVKDFH